MATCDAKILEIVVPAKAGTRRRSSDATGASARARAPSRGRR